eukprot:NODE_498_length_7675_cov_0.481389.p2 type:complete len:312 gc:universal NODE_498_length_7675_cov_0.481389:2147-3082(+)
MSRNIPGQFPNFNESIFNLIDRIILALTYLISLIPPPIEYDFSTSSSEDSVYDVEEIQKIGATRKKTIFNVSNISQDVNMITIQDFSRLTLMRNLQESRDTLHTIPMGDSSNESLLKRSIPSSKSSTDESLTKKSEPMVVSVSSAQSVKSITSASPSTISLITIKDTDSSTNLRGQSFSTTFQNRNSIPEYQLEQETISVASFKNVPTFAGPNIIIPGNQTQNDKNRKQSRPVAFQPSGNNSKASLIPIYDDPLSNKVVSEETVNKTINNDQDSSEGKTINLVQSNDHSFNDYEKSDIKSKIASLRYLYFT